MVLRQDLLGLRTDLLNRLVALARKQAPIGAQDLHVGNFTPAYAASLLPRLVRAGLLEEWATGGMHGGIVYRVKALSWEGAAVVITPYLTALGERGFEYKLQPPRVAAPLHTPRGLAEAVG